MLVPYTKDNRFYTKNEEKNIVENVDIVNFIIWESPLCGEINLQDGLLLQTLEQDVGEVSIEDIKNVANEIEVSTCFKTKVDMENFTLYIYPEFIDITSCPEAVTFKKI